jgi:hypothetical protein
MSLLEEAGADAIVKNPEIFRAEHPDALVVQRMVWVSQQGQETLDGSLGYAEGYPVFFAYL